jgi:penicillin-binding protein 1A
MPVSRELHGPRVEVDAPYVSELVRLALYETYGEGLYTDGYKVVTTIDSRLQRAADVALRSAVLEYDRRHGYRGRIARLGLPAGAEDAAVAVELERYPVVGGLQPAAVVAVGRDDATVVARNRKRYRLPMEGMRWAKPARNAEADDPAPQGPREVVATGDVVYVLPSAGNDALLAQLPEAQGALVALDPHDGAVVAMTGGFDYQASKFNRVTQARRQPGSSFKPFIYSAALEAGFTPASIVLDAPVVFETPASEDGTVEEEDWRPVNDSGRFSGPTRLRDALARSRNLVTIRVMRQIGIAYARDYAQRFGLPKEHIPADLTAALGTAQLTPLEMATGFAVFANGGSRVSSYLIEKIYAADGSILKQAEPRLACADCALPNPDGGGAAVTIAGDRLAPRAIPESNAWIMTDLMREVIRSGTGQRARALGRADIAGKTGTTNEGRDAWFSGFNADLVATAWVGFDQERSLGTDEEGSHTALPMWIYFMRDALAGRPSHRLPMPDGIVTARISPETGELAGGDDPTAIFEYFQATHLPAGFDGGTGGTQPGAQAPKKYEEPIF